MSKKQRRCNAIGGRHVVVPLLALFCLVGVPPAQGQVFAPLQIAAAEPILNEHGQTIEGHARQDPAERALVHILYVGEGRQPPHEWTGEPQNSVFLETRIGTLVAPALTHSGLFGATVPDRRPAGGQEVFVRVYNRPTYGESLFYAESTNTLMVTDSDAPLLVYVGGMTNIVHYRSSAGDGLPDWWKQKYGLDVTRWYDADAQRPGFDMTLREELIAGTDPTDPDSRFILTSVEPLRSASDYQEHVWTDDEGLTYTQRIYDVIGDVVSWPSYEGRRYRIEYATNLLLGGYQLLFGAEDLPATPHRNVFTNIPMPEDGVPIFYRARVWWPDLYVDE